MGKLSIYELTRLFETVEELEKNHSAESIIEAAEAMVMK